MNSLITCFSLWQPWASLLALEEDVKPTETRGRAMPPHYIGQRIAIHAALKVVHLRNLDHALQDLCAELFGEDWHATLPRGAFVGSGVAASSVLMGTGPGGEPVNDRDRLCGNWAPGRFAWRFADRSPLRTPVPAKGSQGWWKTLPSQLPEIAHLRTKP